MTINNFDKEEYKIEKIMEKIKEKIKEENEGQPKMAGKVHIEAFSDGEKVEEHDHDCDGFVVMAFMGDSVTINIHGCCIAQMAAAIDGHEELSKAAELVENRKAEEKLHELLQGILDKQTVYEK